MNIPALALAASFALATVGSAHAEDLRPLQARSVDLGALSGVAYYTAERDGFHMVATLAEGDTGTPIRFEAVLAAGQSVVLSTPRSVGSAANSVEIRRVNDTVLVQKLGVALTN